MATRQPKFLACDRCPIGKQKAATRVETISIGDSRWELDLCEDCGNRLDRDIYAWGRLGKQAEERGSGNAQRQITADYLVEARRVAELRSKQAAQDSPRPRIQVNSAQVVARGLPEEAGQWTFSQHALDRMNQRKVSVIEALRAAVLPTVKRNGDRPGIFLHETEGIKVAVNPKAKEILTVARQLHPTREAI